MLHSTLHAHPSPYKALRWESRVLVPCYRVALGLVDCLAFANKGPIGVVSLDLIEVLNLSVHHNLV